VSASSLTFGLRDVLATNLATAHIFEMGRVAGGRATTRTTREMPGLRIDHGVPAFSAHTSKFRELCDQMLEIGSLRHAGHGDDLFGLLKVDGTFQAEEKDGAPTRFCAPVGKGISAFCDVLLRGGEPTAQPVAELSMGTMVGAFDFLVVTSTGLAHPRWRTTFGGEPPLVEAAQALRDASLDDALTKLAPLTAKPVTACLLAFEGGAAKTLAELPFNVAKLEADPTLAKIVVQRLSPSLTAVVLHSTHQFAEGAAKVYGAKSTAARIAGAASDEQEEEKILDAMLDAASRRLGTLLLDDVAVIRQPTWGPHLHRWGAAFPDAPLLHESNAFIPSANVAFAGDFVEVSGAEGRAGSVEGAALSGLGVAEAIRRHLKIAP
jgi:predicted NAD/FAD-dependent oxidoreductase